MNSTPFKIASRYLFSRKTRNIINLISGISLVVVACVTAAMIILLSVFNGIEGLVDQLYNKFDPDITISAVKGKVLENDSINFEEIKSIEGVESISSALTETAIITKGEERKTLCEIIGIDTIFTSQSNFKQDVIYGRYALHEEGVNFVIPGAGVANDLGVQLRNGEAETLKIYAPIRGKRISVAKEKAFKEEIAMCAGAFNITAELDMTYVVTSLEFARDLFNYENQSSFLGIELKENNSDEIEIRNLIQNIVGPTYAVKTRKEKNPLVYETNKGEKRATFLILVFVLIIAVFNGMASLTMLVLEKRRDISVLKSMGATWSFVKQVFILEGLLINFIGTLVGSVLGLLVCYVQKTFGIVRLHGTVVEFYPVEVEWGDVIMVLLTVVLVGTTATVLMVNYLISRLKLEQK